jgi:hypothetical protein
MLRLFTLATAVVIGISSFAMAFEGKGAPKGKGAAKARISPEERFKKLDKDGNGKVTLDELKGHAKDPAKAEMRFKHLDKDGNGSVSLDEFKAGAERHGKKK